MEKILSAEEWFEQQGNLTKTNYHINEYAKYLLQKQSEYICNTLIGNGEKYLVKKASTEFINQLNERQ